MTKKDKQIHAYVKFIEEHGHVARYDAATDKLHIFVSTHYPESTYHCGFELVIAELNIDSVRAALGY